MNKLLKSIREKLTADKKTLTNLTAAFALGVALIICGNTLFGEAGAKPDEERPANLTVAAEITPSYEEQLEKRLKAVFETVEGAGRVSVMLTLSNGKEIVIAEDTVSQRTDNRETDGAGGEREQHSVSVNGTKIIVQGEGGERRPIVLKEIEPRVEGVIIVAQGGDNVFVVDALIRATQTVLGVEPHKVQVLKMRDDVQ